MVAPSVVHEEPLAEEGARTSRSVDGRTGAEDHAKEVAAEMPEEPKVPKDENTLGSSFVAKMASDLGTIITEVAQTYAEVEASRAFTEANKRLEAELAATKEKIASLEDTLRLQQVMRLLNPCFPMTVLNPQNTSATCSEDLYGFSGRAFSSPPRPGSSSDPRSPGQSGSSGQAGPSGSQGA
ncbi:hypothetical protein Nepgr_017270 [Nepenthes gracilis]|uniref:Uncharacterized protein n=1 Tax=Nepenthes gracilis TaxID=150966 RepID=A0AAD3SRB8_NEPGR|nr:hypothetical protein Nepgr_017270 [Nepenthes gracilis]